MGNYSSGIQNGAGQPLWMWFQTHSCITENLRFPNCIKPRDTTSLVSKRQLQPCSLEVTPTLQLQKQHPYFWSAPILILDNLCYLAVFCLLSTPLLCRAATQFKCFLGLLLPRLFLTSNKWLFVVVPASTRSPFLEFLTKLTSN